MFFKKRIDGEKFGSAIVEMIHDIVQQEDKRIYYRIMERGEPNEVSDLHFPHFFNKIISLNETTCIWALAMKYIIPFATKDANSHKVQYGIDKKLSEIFSSESAMQFDNDVKNLVYSDKTYIETGFLQDYDINLTRELHARSGLSYQIARFIVEHALLQESFEAWQKDSILSNLVVQFEEFFRLTGEIYKKTKIV